MQKTANRRKPAAALDSLLTAGKPTGKVARLTYLIMTNLNMSYRIRIHPKHSQHMSLARPPWQALLTTLLFALVASGCSNRNAAPANPANATVDRGGDWFCQPAAAGADDPWECVQDKNLAANPKPDRLPNADTPAKVPTKSPFDVDTSQPTPQINGADVPLPANPPPPPPGLS